MKNKRGITLIALILTVIIMLILASVSFDALLGDNGIISQAMASKNNTDEAKIKELIQMAWAARMNKFFEETGRNPSDSNYLLEIGKDLNLYLGGAGSILGINYNSSSSVYTIIYQDDKNNSHSIDIKQSGEILDINNFDLANIDETFIKIDEAQEVIEAIPEIFTYFKLDKENKTAAIEYININNVAKVAIPEKVKLNDSREVDENGFEYTVNELYFLAFENDADSLESVVIPQTITIIGDATFEGCKKLKSIIIPKSVTIVVGDAFNGCDSLTSIVVEDGNPVYDSRNDCNAIIETATNKLIFGCNSTIIPNDIRRIDSYAFSKRIGIEEIVIPTSVEIINVSAFYGCTNLETVRYTGTESQWNNIRIESDNAALLNATKEYNYGL